MIRIDENTYIDDTLVTCAEYQLFIDEMREQGIYYQPDHWTSYQFPRRQASKPIVGIRISDAIAFCEWLTLREIGEWLFRLPTSIEAEQHPLGNQVQSQLGYWTIELDGKIQFARVGFIPDNSQDVDNPLQIFIKSWWYLRTIARTHTRDQSLALERDLDDLRPSGLELDFIQARDRALDRDLKNDRTRNIDRASNIGRTFLIEFAHNINPNLDPDLVLDRAKNLIRNYPILIESSVTTELYFDIFRLQERIAGRSPAFEGIRLVKERKP